MEQLPNDPPLIGELMEWCFQRLPGDAARRRRVARLFHEFRDVINREVPIITVAGTSGKGTTCALLEAVLAACGHVPGVYTKPHLVSFRERVRVAGRAVPEREFIEHARLVFERLRELVARHGEELRPSLYEALVLIAASIFAQRGVTIAVFEASVGGASCATSFLQSMLSVVTSVDLDHQADLGPTVEAIAKDKAGIVPPRATLVLGAGTSESVRAVVQAECTARRAQLVQADRHDIEVLSTGVNGQTIRYSHAGEPRTVFLPFAGRHQALNFATVWAVVRELHAMEIVRDLDAIRGVENARIAGRFEFVHGTPSWLLDVAHNPASVAALIETALQLLPRENLVAVVAASKRHDHAAMMRLLAGWGIPLGFCDGFSRALPANQLCKEASPRAGVLGVFGSPVEAVNHCLNSQSLAGATVVVTGSLFLVGECRRELVRHGIFPEAD